MEEESLFERHFCLNISTFLAVCGEIDDGIKNWNIQSVFE
jgi:hypothetical protein